MARGYPDFQGDKKGLSEEPEWAAFEGVDRNFSFITVNLDFEDDDTSDYVVPAGSTLYITSLTFAVYATLEGHADNNQHAEVCLQNHTTFATYVSLGGNGGGSINLSKPVVFPGGDTFRIYIESKANHVIRVWATAHGYEV